MTELKVREVDAISVNVTLNSLCRNNTDYTVQVFFGVRKQGSDEKCVPQLNVTANIAPGESVIFTVNTNILLKLDHGQEYIYCSTIATPTGETTVYFTHWNISLGNYI